MLYNKEHTNTQLAIIQTLIHLKAMVASHVYILSYNHILHSNRSITIILNMQFITFTPRIRILTNNRHIYYAHRYLTKKEKKRIRSTWHFLIESLHSHREDRQK